MTHTVHFEPVGLDIEVEEDESILEAAFRQGIMLMHGCKEGQCSACKSFLLDGDFDMDRYSTFALSEFEAEEGYVLLCKGHAYSDLEIELINYDEDMLRAGVPIRTARTEVAAVETLSPDIRRLVLSLVEPRELAFKAGQYVDITIPGTGRTRSFSMANTPATDDRLEFLIKIYPNGAFSQLLDDQLRPGDELAVKGPYGMCTLRETSSRDLVLVGGGAGMAPLLGLVRQLAEDRSDRRVTFYYGARRGTDLICLEELAELGASLPGFRFVPALSEATGDEDWEGEVGLITDVVDRDAGDLAEVDAYLCGPPPMIDAAVPVLQAKGVGEHRIFFDKFTISADAAEEGA